ncbi:MAG: hypothetical protein KGL39_30785 [Patescibacteria group bacterium]|nr:hypothetical protein [Patescibacteria group bacterium]
MKRHTEDELADALSPLTKEEREAVGTLSSHNERDRILIGLFYRLAFPDGHPLQQHD